MHLIIHYFKQNRYYWSLKEFLAGHHTYHFMHTARHTGLLLLLLSVLWAFAEDKRRRKKNYADIIHTFLHSYMATQRSKMEINVCVRSMCSLFNILEKFKWVSFSKSGCSNDATMRGWCSRCWICIILSHLHNQFHMWSAAAAFQKKNHRAHDQGKRCWRNI